MTYFTKKVGCYFCKGIAQRPRSLALLSVVEQSRVQHVVSIFSMKFLHKKQGFSTAKAREENFFKTLCELHLFAVNLFRLVRVRFWCYFPRLLLLFLWRALPQDT